MKSQIILGTYTRGNSEGIYTIQLDHDNKQLEHLELVAKSESPTYLATESKRPYLYAVYSKDGKGGVGSFTKDGTFVDAYVEEGSAPCYVAYDEERQLVYSANYHQGLLHVLSVDDSGHLKLADRITHEGSGPHANQEKAHAHYFDLTPDHKFVLSCDLGTDKVQTYQIDEEGKAHEVASLDVDPGTGPRHIAFHPDGQYAYIFGELSSQIITVSYDSNTGELTPVDSITTLPLDFDGESSGAALRVTKDGRFLYATNRGYDSIVAFEVQEDRTLLPLELYPSEGQTPRDFNLSEDERFLVVGHQHEDKLTLFQRNEDTGKLTLVQKDVYAPEVVCVHFI